MISDGGVAPLELIDWSFGRHPKFSQPEEMAADVGISIYRTLLAVFEPVLPAQRRINCSSAPTAVAAMRTALACGNTSLLALPRRQGFR